MTNTVEHGAQPLEVWRQDKDNSDLWYGPNEVIVNSFALAERESYFEVVHIPSANLMPVPRAPISQVFNDETPAYVLSRC